MHKSSLSLSLLRGAGAGVLALLPVAAAAQAPPPAPPAPGPVVTRRLTLDDALQVAEGGSEQVAAAEAGVRRASGQIDLVRSGLFPQLGSSIGYQRTLQTQFDGIFDTGSTTPPCADLTVKPDAPIEERVAEI